MQKILSPMDLFPIFAKTNVATGAVEIEPAGCVQRRYLHVNIIIVCSTLKAWPF